MRSLDEITRDTLGNLSWQLVLATAEIERLKAEIAKLTAPKPDATPAHDPTL